MADTHGTLTFLEQESWPSYERPYEIVFQPPDKNIPACNYRTVKIPNVPIHDLRPVQGKLSLDREGFFVAQLNTSIEYDEYFDEEQLKLKYVPQIKAFLKRNLGVRAVYIHECVIRRSGENRDDSANYGKPIANIHTDYTHNYALELLEQLTGDKTQAEEIRKSRIQMLNIWKPLRGPIRNWPLALCDLRSLDSGDLVVFDEVHPRAVLESQQVTYNPSQKWYYLSNQETDEIIVFKSMDTVVRGEVAHGSFYNPNCPENEPPRESIEMRILVVY